MKFVQCCIRGHLLLGGEKDKSRELLVCVCVCRVELDGVQKVCSALTIASVEHNQAKSDL